MTARIPVLFDRALRPEWIDYALAQFVRTADNAAHGRLLRTYLEEEITSPDTLRKTVRQLQRYVGHLSPLTREQLLAVYEDMNSRAPTQRGEIRIRLLSATNPFLADCLAAIRSLNSLGVQGITRRQMVERLIARYGERGTIPRRVGAALTTLAHLHVLENRDKKWFVVDRSLLDASDLRGG